MEYDTLKPCPHCGSKNLRAYAFSLSTDAGIVCNDCGFFIEEEVSWDGCDPGVPRTDPEYAGRCIAAHDKKAYGILKGIWNNMSEEEAKTLYKKEND